jgi:hypothetical protein
MDYHIQCSLKNIAGKMESVNGSGDTNQYNSQKQF